WLPSSRSRSFLFRASRCPHHLHSFPTRRSPDLDGGRVEVALPGDLALGGGAGGARKKAKKKRAGGAKKAASGDAVVAPMQGTVIKVAVEEGAEVAEGDTVVVLEAMKMENPVKAHKAGTVTGLAAEEGAGVGKGDVLMEIK